MARTSVRWPRIAPHAALLDGQGCDLIIPVVVVVSCHVSPHQDHPQRPRVTTHIGTSHGVPSRSTAVSIAPTPSFLPFAVACIFPRSECYSCISSPSPGARRQLSSLEVDTACIYDRQSRHARARCSITWSAPSPVSCHCVHAARPPKDQMDDELGL